MTDYQIQASSRRCAITGRELQPGERCFSVLLEEGGSLVRKDYSLEVWHGPPPGAFGFWQSRPVSSQAQRRPPIDDELLLECFRRLAADGESGVSNQDGNRSSFRYVLALLLMRRRRLRLEDTRQEGSQEVLILRCMRSGERFGVLDPGLSDEQLETVQDDVFRVLGWE
jgi:hypothetical protein